MGPELFGVGFAEAVLVFVIALIVVGPQRFPALARQSGRWYRVARRYTAEITADLRGALSELEDEVKAEGGDLRSIRELGEEIEGDLKATERELDAAGGDADADPAQSSSPSAAAGDDGAAAAAPSPSESTDAEARPGATDA
jgi:sec-independent protein translocase protein TatB